MFTTILCIVAGIRHVDSGIHLRSYNLDESDVCMKCNIPYGSFQIVVYSMLTNLPLVVPSQSNAKDCNAPAREIIDLRPTTTSTLRSPPSQPPPYHEDPVRLLIYTGGLIYTTCWHDHSCARREPLLAMAQPTLPPRYEATLFDYAYDATWLA